MGWFDRQIHMLPEKRLLCCWHVACAKWSLQNHRLFSNIWLWLVQWPCRHLCLSISRYKKDIRNKESASLDEIRNEVLKYGISVLEKTILHLFYTVNIIQSFPTLWNEGLIIPIFRKGDPSNTDDYRGIVISSCVGKLYLKILTKSIGDNMVASGLWSQNQCSFKKDHRTEDMLFVLNSIYESNVVNKNQIIYPAFVNFSKYFDMINRKLLFYKLLK